MLQIFFNNLLTKKKKKKFLFPFKSCKLGGIFLRRTLKSLQDNDILFHWKYPENKKTNYNTCNDTK